MQNRITHYRIEGLVGEGAFAWVYRAFDQRLERHVALKVLKPFWMSDPKAVARFQHEAKMMARLHHPHIVVIHEVGEEEGQVYLAEHLVEGESLAVRLQRGALPWDEALRILKAVASALDYAHSHGIVHRDIKPANILLAEDGGVYLSDFGLVRAAEGSVSISSSTGGMVGTPPYMAPEQWEGQAATGATDVYSLSCVIVEMLTGSVLFDGATPGTVMKQHLMDGPPLPEKWSPGVPPGVAEVLRHGLAQAAAERASSAGMLAAELASLWELGKAEEEIQRLAGRAEQVIAERDEARGETAGVRRIAEDETRRRVETERRLEVAEETLRGRQPRAHQRHLIWGLLGAAAGVVLMLIVWSGTRLMSGGAIWSMVPPRYDSSTGDIFWVDDHLLWAQGDRVVAVPSSASGPLTLVADGRGGDIQVILQDAEDQLWIGLAGEGLDYRRGNEWTRYRFREGVEANTVQAIASDGATGAWVGTKDGAAHFDGEAWTFFTSADGLSGDDIRAIAIAGDGVTWFGTWGGGLTSWHRGNMVRYDLGDSETWNRITALQPLGSDLWIGTQGGLMRLGPSGTWEPHTRGSDLPDDFVTALAADPVGRIWIGTWGGGVGAFDGSQLVSHVLKQGRYNYIVDLAVGGEKVWVLSPAGLMVLDLETGVWDPY